MAPIQVIFLLEPLVTPVRTYGLAKQRGGEGILWIRATWTLPPPTFEGKILPRLLEGHFVMHSAGPLVQRQQSPLCI